jgi:hypothetical protein
MNIYFPRCKRKHSLRECSLDNISVCGFCIEDHSTKKCRSFPGLLAIYKSGDTRESSYAPRRPWQPRNQPTYPDIQSQVPPYYQQQQQWNSPSWKNFFTQYQRPWLQGWRTGHNQGNPQAPAIPMSKHPYPLVPTEHSIASARFCSTTFTSYSTTTNATIPKCKLPETNTITSTTSIESQ